MALGLIQFLLGGKTKKAPSKNQNASSNEVKNTENNNNEAQSSSPIQQESQNRVESNTSNQNEQRQQTSQSSSQSSNAGGNKKSVSEVLMKIHKEMKETNERLTSVVTDVKKLENSVNSLAGRVENLDKKDRENDAKFKEINSNMGQFLSLYELINNQYNPFVSQEDMPMKNLTSAQAPETPPVIEESQENPIELDNFNDNSNGSVLEHMPEDNSAFSIEGVPPLSELKSPQPQKEVVKEEPKTIVIPKDTNSSFKMSPSLLELDTLNIEAAASDAVPLTMLKNNTNALVIILSWMEYLIKNVGIEETRNTLRYYTETLRWMTPEVFFDLDKYLRGMSDNPRPSRAKTNVRDHIVSLYFISKLNEKSLDEKLTKAVLEIIQE